MLIGTADVSLEVGKWPFKDFKLFFEKVLKGKTEMTVEEAFEKLGGKHPRKAKQK